MSSETRDPKALAEAAECLEQGLHLLDRGGAPPHIGAEVDLALCRLRALLSPGVTVFPAASSCRSAGPATSV